MPHISKKYVQVDTYRDIQKQLVSVLSKLSRGDEKNPFVEELLTRTERIMLAKRLAVLLMINRGHSLYKISRTLRVSPSTAARLESAMDQGMFKTLLAKATKGKLEKALEELITFIAIPLTTPYKGAKGIKLNFD